MATITAKNIGRINVWPTYAVAQEADTAESKFTGQLTVWRTNEEAKANISHEEGSGGGGAPDWVPANAVIHIDLVGGTPQGRAWVAGTGEVAVETLLGADANTEIGWTDGPSSYSPGILVPGQGYGDFTDLDYLLVALIGEARDRVVAGCTFTLQLNSTSGVTDRMITFAMLSTDGMAALELRLGTLGSAVYFETWGGSASITSIDVLDPVGVNKIAGTFVPIRADISANGSTAETTVLTTDDFPVTGPSAISCVVIDLTNYRYLQSITLYDPLPSTAGLSELSEV